MKQIVINNPEQKEKSKDKENHNVSLLIEIQLELDTMKILSVKNLGKIELIK